MAALNGPVYVPAPNPVVPRYGLFSAATGPLDLPAHARQGGLQYELSTCALPLGYTVACIESHAAKAVSGSVGTVTATPFVVYSSINCSPVGLANWGQERVQQLLYQQLVAGEQSTVERLFSESTFGLSPGLGGATPAAVNLGNVGGIVRAFGTLESWLYARYGIPGVIHVPMLAASYVKGAHLVEQDSPVSPWRTAPKSVVSFGNYAGTGPTGQVPAAGDTWIYITGQVAVWRTPDSELFVPSMGQIINRSTNVLNIVMEREYVVSYDCYIAAVQVTLTNTDT